MTTARKWILTALIASAAALTAAAAALLTHRESPAPLQTLQSAAEYEAKAAEAHADPPAQTAVTHGSAEDLADLAEIADKLPETGYLLKLHGDTLAVYEDGLREPIAEYDLPAGWLPDYDRILLEYGFRVSGKEELRELLEDYVS